MTWFEEIYDYIYIENSDWHDTQSYRENASIEVESIEKLFSLHAGSSILDIGCSTGRHSIALAKHGYKVTGIDLSEKLIDKAKNRAKDENLDINFKTCDMRDINFSNEFEAVIMMDVTFGIFEDDENEALLSKIYHSLKENGQTFFSLFNPYYWATHPHSTHYKFGDVDFIRKYSFNAVEGRVEDTHLYINAKAGVRKQLPTQTLRAYTPREMNRICQKAGFTDFHLYGESDCGLPTDKIPFDPASSFMMYIKVGKH
jgi:2-polyprenyl-3-methyl-5-hydroxy-6-metoxy-1,4-benzoquinol methylase